MFYKKNVDTPRMRETEIYYKGEYGRKGESLPKRRKPTKEEMDQANYRHRVKELRRVIQMNFTEEDHLLTFKPKRGCGWTIEDLIKAWKKFSRKLRALYKKHGRELKFIYRLEIGKKGGLHFHLLINEAGITLNEITEIWKSVGGHNVNSERLYDDGGYEDLAEYIVKASPSEIKGQITMDSYQLEKLSRYGCSRNLKRPEPEIKEYSRRTVEEIIRYGVKPDEGYYLDKDSVYIGKNPYTGYSYIFYRQYKIQTAGDMRRARERIAPVQDIKHQCVDEYRKGSR